MKRIVPLFLAFSVAVSASSQVVLSPTQKHWGGFAQGVVGSSTDKRDKAFKIYRWLCNYISYDTSHTIRTADECFDSNSGMCQAYCELFYRMADAVGVKVKIIQGMAKDSTGEIVPGGHSWIYAYTDDGKGILIDPTFGAGTVTDGVFKRSDNDNSWFDVDPYWMIFTHLPDEKMAEWQLLDEPVDSYTFRRLPPLCPWLGNVGYDARGVFEDCKKGSAVEVPDIYSPILSRLKIKEIPRERHLRVGRYYDFTIAPKTATELRIHNGTQFIKDWENKDGDATCRFMPSEAGILEVSWKEKDGNWYNFVTYNVAEPTESEIAALEAEKPHLSPVWKNVANYLPKSLALHGIEIPALLKKVRAENIKALPKVFDKCQYTIQDVPMNGVLENGKSYTFVFTPEKCSDVAIINGEEWFQNWQKDKKTGQWSITVTPKNNAPLYLAIQLHRNGDYWPCLEYVVR